MSLPKKTLWETEQPDSFDLTVYAALTALGFEDTSWHNDTCGSMTWTMQDGTQLRVWVAEKRASEREVHGTARFSVCLYDADNSIIPGGLQVSCDAFPPVLRILNAVLQLPTGSLRP